MSFLSKIFDPENRQLSSPLEMAAILERIQTETVSKAPLLGGLFTQPGIHWYGQVDNDSFCLNRLGGGRNSFGHCYRGRLRQGEQGGTRIEIEARISPFVQAFTTLWLVCVVCLGTFFILGGITSAVVGLAKGDTEYIGAGLIAPFFALPGLFMLFLGRWAVKYGRGFDANYCWPRLERLCSTQQE